MSFTNGGNSEHEPLLQTNTSLDATVQHDPRTIHCCWLLMILIAASYAFTEAPLLRLYESVICRQYYRIHDPSVIGHNGTIPEMRCKLDGIQHDVTMVTSWQVQINSLVSLLASFHTAILCRWFGRRHILQLNMLLHLCAQVWIYIFLNYPGMPIRLTWISSAFLLVASGPEMRQETIFMIITDATPTTDQLTVFTTGQIIVYPLAYLIKIIAACLMHYSIWIPLVCGPLMILAGIMVVRRLLPPEANIPGYLDRHSPEHLGWFLAARRETKEIFQFLSLSWCVRYLTPTYLVTTIFSHAMSGSVFLQYVEKRTGMNIADASKLQANSDIMNMVLLIFTVVFFGRANAAVLGAFGGRLGKLLARLIGRARIIPAREITICLFCAFLMTLGLSIIGIAHDHVALLLGLLICASGQSFRMSARSTLNAIIHELEPDKDHTTGLYTIITYIDFLGGAFNSFALATSFTEGLKLGGRWIGLPFFYGAFMWSVVIIIVFFVRLFMPNEAQSLSSSMDQSNSSLLSANSISDISSAPAS